MLVPAEVILGLLKAPFCDPHPFILDQQGANCAPTLYCLHKCRLLTGKIIPKNLAKLMHGRT